jgi:hypothetical protein
MLVDPNFTFKNEMAGITSILADDYQSDLGKTAGPLAPNEFWYFWRRFFPYGEIQYLSEQELSNADTETFLRELAALEAAFDKPLILKGLIANWNLPFLAETLEKALFLYIRRDPFFTIQSLLQSRLKFFGTLDRWYSLKPPEYERLQELDPFHQVAGQVFFTNQAIQQGLQLIAPTRWIEVDYENFCSNPKDIWQLLNQRFYDYGYKINAQAEKSVQFESQNRITIAPKQQEKVIAAYRDLFQIDITPTSQSVSTP